jgi:hypothetical protein
MKKNIIIFIGLVVLLGVSGFSNPVKAVSAVTSSDITVQTLLNQINQLKTQILDLQSKLEIAKKAEEQVKETVKDIKTTLKVAKQLRLGTRGEDVKLLQEALATDPDIYPEGLITGYYGNLTEKAVKKFQKSLCLDQVGVVGPKTLSKINELLEEGAGNSGKVPSGLLTAPGIRKKFCSQPQSGTSTSPEQSCTDSGGQTATSSCCLSANNFPNLCLIGACGCDSTNSQDVKICNCGGGKCFNGKKCVGIE